MTASNVTAYIIDTGIRTPHTTFRRPGYVGHQHHRDGNNKITNAGSGSPNRLLFTIGL